MLCDKRRISIANSETRHCRFISSVTAVGDCADELATLAAHYLNSNARTQRSIAKGFDPLSPVLKLL